MKGVRYTFPSGVIAEFTHDQDCLQPQEEWVKAHQRSAKKAVVEAFDSDHPVSRTFWPDQGAWVDKKR